MVNKAQGKANTAPQGAEQATPAQMPVKSGATEGVGARVSTRLSIERADLGVDSASVLPEGSQGAPSQHGKILLDGIGVGTVTAQGPPARLIARILSVLSDVLHTRGKLGAVVVTVTTSSVAQKDQDLSNVGSSTGEQANAQSVTSRNGERGQGAKSASGNRGETVQRTVKDTDSKDRPSTIIGRVIARISDRISGSESVSAKEANKVGVVVAGLTNAQSATSRNGERGHNKPKTAEDKVLAGTAGTAKDGQTQGSIRASGIRSGFNKVFIFSLAVFLTPLTAFRQWPSVYRRF